MEKWYNVNDIVSRIQGLEMENKNLKAKVVKLYCNLEEIDMELTEARKANATLTEQLRAVSDLNDQDYKHKYTEEKKYSKFLEKNLKGALSDYTRLREKNLDDVAKMHEARNVVSKLLKILDKESTT